MDSDIFLGIDIGSVSIKTALIDANAGLLAETYFPDEGLLIQIEQQSSSGLPFIDLNSRSCAVKTCRLSLRRHVSETCPKFE